MLKKIEEKVGRCRTLLDEVEQIMTNPEATEEERESVTAKIKEVHALKAEAATLKEIQELGQQMVQHEADVSETKRRASVPDKFSSFGEYLLAIYKAGTPDTRFYQDPRLGKRWKDTSEPVGDPAAMVVAGRREVMGGFGPVDTKVTMAEGTGATGGFLVPVEFRAELYAVLHEQNVVRARATVIPMRRRQVAMPVLDQTATTAGQPSSFGGILATWTEEQGQKAQNDPTFRQIQLVAHKLVCYTRSSDELLDDSAIGLDAFLRSDRGFAGAINWFEEFAFFQGTGAGQPLGVINAGATVTVPAAAAGVISVADITLMTQAIQGSDPLWHISRGQMSQLLLLNGPAGNPSFFFLPNAREGMPATLMGWPIHWTEKLPAPNVTGSVLLVNWADYFIGDRQATTIESTNIERFRNDETSWRAVHRVDGQPALSAPMTLADGVTQISPFVMLGAVAS